MLMRSPWVRRLGSAGRALLVVRVRDAVNVAIGVGVVTRTSTHRPHTHTLTQAQARLFSATTATGVPPPPPEPRAWERQAYALHAVTARRSVPLAVPKPTYALDGRSVPLPSRVTLYSEEEILCAKKANVLASVMRKYAGTLVKPGVTPDEIDAAVHDKIVSLGAYPAPLNYYGFPKSICSSPNQVICHGIPDTRPLRWGDILKLDVSVFAGGFFGDCCGTFAVGGARAVDAAGRNLIFATKRSLAAAIAICRDGERLNRIGETIQGGEMRRGMVFTIEPMITEGDPAETTLEDHWTVVTVDGSRAAQIEETVAISHRTGEAEVLTSDSKHDFEHFFGVGHLPDHVFNYES